MTNACKTPEAVMQTLITALAAGLAVWGAVQLLESFQSGGERQRAQALDLIKAGGEIVRTATWEVSPTLWTLPSLWLIARTARCS